MWPARYSLSVRHPGSKPPVQCQRKRLVGVEENHAMVGAAAEEDPARKAWGEHRTEARRHRNRSGIFCAGTRPSPSFPSRRCCADRRRRSTARARTRPKAKSPAHRIRGGNGVNRREGVGCRAWRGRAPESLRAPCRGLRPLIVTRYLQVAQGKTRLPHLLFTVLY
jgi:hypothetical protein